MADENIDRFYLARNIYQQMHQDRIIYISSFSKYTNEAIVARNFESS